MQVAPRATTPGSVPDDRFDERSLVEAARHDANAFAELYRRYLPRIYAYAYRRSSSQQVAEDVSSATFEKALAAIGEFEWRSVPFDAWLFRIASHELASYYRAQARSESDRGQRAMSVLHQRSRRDELERVDQRESAAMVRHAMGMLSPRYQRVLALRYLSGLSDDSAAQAMGVSKPLFSVLVHRATAALRREVNRAETEER